MENDVETVDNNGTQVTSIDDKLSLIPDKCDELVVVELPCITNDPVIALKILGGKEHVFSAIERDHTSIQAHFDTHTFSKPIIGDKTECSGVLLRMKRKRKHHDSQATNQDMEIAYDNSVDILGFVPKMYSFTKPFDFEFIAAVQDPCIETSDVINEEIIETVPFKFSYTHIDKSVKSIFTEYSKGFRSYLDDRRKASQEPSVQPSEQPNDSQAPVSEITFSELVDTSRKIRKRPLKLTETLLKFEDDPPIDPPPDTLKRRHIMKYSLVRDVLDSLFAIQPVWLRKHLLMHPTLIQYSNAFKELLPYVAYTYKSGPYRGCWIKYGYNALQDPSSKIFTQINVRLLNVFDPKTYQPRILSHIGTSIAGPHERIRVDLDKNQITVVRVESTGSQSTSAVSNAVEIFFYESEITSQMNIDITSFREDDIVDFMKQWKLLSECNESTGWLPKDMVAGLRERIQLHIKDCLDKFLETPRTQLLENMKRSYDVEGDGNETTESASDTIQRVFGDLFLWQTKFADIIGSGMMIEDYMRIKSKPSEKLDQSSTTLRKPKSSAHAPTDTTSSSKIITKAKAVIRLEPKTVVIKSPPRSQKNDDTNAKSKELDWMDTVKGFDVFESESDSDEDSDYNDEI